jgi:hypothetical protein
MFLNTADIIVLFLLVLYKTGPAYYHATYSVIVKAVRSSDLSTVSPVAHLASNWTSLSCLNRVTEQVSKVITSQVYLQSCRPLRKCLMA